MNCLTVCQPFAELIASGIKRVENRSWKPPLKAVGQPLLIHAGANRKLYLPQIMKYDREHTLPCRFSRIVARCELAAVVTAEEARQLPALAGQHEYIEGPWCWVLTLIEPLDIAFLKGERGVYDVDLDVARRNAPYAISRQEERRAASRRQLARWNARRAAEKAAGGIPAIGQDHREPSGSPTV